MLVATDGTISGPETGITVTPAAASTLVVSGFPSSPMPVWRDLTITALDPYGNVATGYTDCVNLTGVVDTPSLPIAFTPADAGVLTISVAMPSAGTGQTITATDTTTPSITGTRPASPWTRQAWPPDSA